MISVLVVDDEKLIRDTLVRYIKWQELGIDLVYEAANGKEALAMIELKNPSFMITDIKMPHMDGIKLAEEIRERFPDIRLIFLSGHADKDYLKAAIHLHADGYIEKPLNLQEISCLVKDVAAKCRKELLRTNPQLYFFHGDSEKTLQNTDTYRLSTTQLQEIGHLFQTASLHAVHKHIQSLMAQIRVCEGTSPAYIRNIYSMLALQLEKAAEFHCAANTQIRCNSYAFESSNAPRLDILEQEFLEILTLFFEELAARDLNPVTLINDYLRKNYADHNLSVEKIAQDLNFNTSYLCTVFKKSTGQTINSFLTSLRVEAARQLLAETNLKLYEIGNKVGYPNGKYFTKVFTKETGLSPRDYRGLHHEKM